MSLSVIVSVPENGTETELDFTKAPYPSNREKVPTSVPAVRFGVTDVSVYCVAVCVNVIGNGNGCFTGRGMMIPYFAVMKLFPFA